WADQHGGDPLPPGRLPALDAVGAASWDRPFPEGERPAPERQQQPADRGRLATLPLRLVEDSAPVAAVTKPEDHRPEDGGRGGDTQERGGAVRLGRRGKG